VKGKQKRKMSSHLSLLAVAVLAVACCVSAELIDPYYTVEYFFDEEERSLVINGTGDMPSPWVRYSAPWYNYRDMVQKVVIEEGVTKISDYAFYECENLVSVSIPSTATYIGGHAFQYCRSLPSVFIPKAVTFIGEDAFMACDSLSSIAVDEENEKYKSVDGVLIDNYDEWSNGAVVIKCPPLRNGPFVIPDDVSVIRPYAFSDTRNLTEITIPEGVVNIGYFAFTECSSLHSVVIPSSVTVIGQNAFEKCSNLTSVTFHEGITNIGNCAFFDCESLTSVSIPQSVTEIWDSAFAGCKSLKSVTIPKNVSTFGYNVFGGCYSLESIDADPEGLTVKSVNGVLFNSDLTELIQYPLARSGSYVIPGSVKHFPSGAFAGSRFLTSLTIPSSVTTIESSSFQGCVNLAEVVIPDSVTSIGMMAFAECTSLKSVAIPPKVTSIIAETFLHCSSLSSVIIPYGVTKIEYDAFEGCSSLKNITVPASVVTISDSAFDKCEELSDIFVEVGNSKYKSIDGVLFTKDEKTLLQYPSGRKGSYTVPRDVESIYSKAFQYCSGITWLTIPASIGMSEIPPFFFHGCINLESVDIPDTVTSIGLLAFYDCISLKSLTIPSSVTSIGERAFMNCSSLESVEVKGNSSNYMSVDGVLLDASGTHLVLYPRGKTGHFDIPGTVTHIDPEAFAYSYGLESVTIPPSVTEIGKDAFLDCYSLKSVNGAAGVTRIGLRAFSGCRSLTLSTLPPSIESFDAFAFYGCEKMTSLIIPSSVTSVEDDAFSYMANLVYVIYKGTSDPGNWSFGRPFYMCTNLEFICVPSNYDSSEFCGRTAITKSDKCEELAANINHCFTVRTNEDVVKRANATAWEDQSDGCFQFICLNDTGRHSWSLCNSTDGGNQICSENQCRDIDVSELSDSGYSVDMMLDPLLINELNKSRDMRVLCNASGTDNQGEVRVSTQADFDGLLIRCIITFDDETSANNLAMVCDTCAAMSFDEDYDEEEDENSMCSGILQHVQSATLIRHTPRLFFIEVLPVFH